MKMVKIEQLPKDVLMVYQGESFYIDAVQYMLAKFLVATRINHTWSLGREPTKAERKEIKRLFWREVERKAYRLKMEEQRK